MGTVKAAKHRRKPPPPVWRWLATLFFGLALAGIAALLLSDAWHRLRPSALHSRMAALPLIMIGLSYACLQFSARRSRRELAQGLALGTAFLLWGGEQLLPPSPWVTLMDCLVVTIFVVDLSFIIAEHLRLKDHDLP